MASWGASAAVAAADKENVAPAAGAATRSTRRKGLGNVQQTPQQPEDGSCGGGSLPKKPVAAVVRTYAVCMCVWGNQTRADVIVDPHAPLPIEQADQQLLPRLLLFTEKAEEVFMLSAGLPEAKERGELAKAVMEDRGNPAVWWRLLQHVGRVFGEPDRCDAKLAYVSDGWMCVYILCTRDVESYTSTYIHSPPIRKLYQKATRIIPEALYKEQGQSPALVNIWLGFAAAERCVARCFVLLHIYCVSYYYIMLCIVYILCIGPAFIKKENRRSSTHVTHSHPAFISAQARERVGREGGLRAHGALRGRDQDRGLLPALRCL